MPISERLKTLGSGVFGRVDAEKRIYRLSEQQQQRPLIDLSLGSSELKPPLRLCIKAVERPTPHKGQLMSHTLHAAVARRPLPQQLKGHGLAKGNCNQG